MSVIVIDDQLVHYEVFGRGTPILFLHGWLGSWRYWFPTMEVVANDFRAYSFDFWGFGDSPRPKTPENIQDYSDQIIRFLNELGIDRISLVGHSMGGMVALHTAINYPNRVVCVVTVGAPIDGHSLSIPLKLTNYRFFANTLAKWPWLRRKLFRFFMGETEDPAEEEIIADSVKATAKTIRSTIGSMLKTDLRQELPRLRVPALIIHGCRDDIVQPRQVDLFAASPSAQVMLLPHSRHFPFLDNATFFNQILLQFLQSTIQTHY